MKATCAPVEGNKVRLTVEVEETEVDHVLEEAVRSIGRQVRVPGFRPGKVPRQVLEARLGGAAALRSEALRGAIPDLYAKAVQDVEVDPISPPEIDVTAGEESGALAFDAVVSVRPSVQIAGYAGLSITLPALGVTDDEVDAQLDRLRETEAELVDVDRPAVDGDRVTIDLRRHQGAVSGDDGLEDFSYELGSGSLVPALDEQLRGAKPGDILFVPGSSGDDPPHGVDPERGGGSGDPDGSGFRVLVKAVREKRLPLLTDEWAAETSEFATLSELRQDLAERVAAAKQAQARILVQERALGALADLVDVDEVPSVLVADQVRRSIHDLSHRLEEQGIGFDRFLEATGRTGDDLVAEVRVDALQTVKVDLALRSLADKEGIEVSDEEMATQIAEMAARMKVAPSALRRQIEGAGTLLAVRSERRKAKALAWLLEHIETVDENGVEIPGHLLRGAGTDLSGEIVNDNLDDVTPGSSKGDGE
ncbi:MAG: trigger factor [Acidimicrobiales bacterium]